MYILFVYVYVYIFISAVDSGTERPVSYRSTGFVALNNICYMPPGPVTKRYRTPGGPGVSTDIIDGPSTSRLSVGVYNVWLNNF